MQIAQKSISLSSSLKRSLDPSYKFLWKQYLICKEVKLDWNDLILPTLWIVGKFWNKMQVSKIFRKTFQTEIFELKYSKENI